MLKARSVLTQHREDENLDFDAMDAFISAILSILKKEGSRAVRIFPPDSNVLLSFAERIANDVVSARCDAECLASSSSRRSVNT